MQNESPAVEATSLTFLTTAEARNLIEQYGSPLYIYDARTLTARAQTALAFPAPFGLTVRYAMKANPLASILRLFNQEGLHVDASSGYEADRAMQAGIAPERIMLTSQQLPHNLDSLIERGVRFNATSLHQLEVYGQAFPGTSVAIRINSGLGSGHTRTVSVAGPTSSFGIWHEQLPEIQDIARRHKLKITTIHSHIGCGADPEIWQQAAAKVMTLLDQFPAATTLNLGGGFKVARMAGETATNLHEVGTSVSRLLQAFYQRTGRRISLEIEPGTFLMANGGTLLARVIDVASTGHAGYSFLKLDAGMNDIMRPALHGSQHPIISLAGTASAEPYVIVGHNCESTDLLTPDPSDPDVPKPRLLPTSNVGDIVAIEGVGAYCSSMRLIGYNSYPVPPEIMREVDGSYRLIKRSQGLSYLTAGEL